MEKLKKEGEIAFAISEAIAPAYQNAIAQTASHYKVMVLLSRSFRHPQNVDRRMLMRQNFQKGTERGGEKLRTLTILLVPPN